MKEKNGERMVAFIEYNTTMMLHHTGNIWYGYSYRHGYRCSGFSEKVSLYLKVLFSSAVNGIQNQ